MNITLAEARIFSRKRKPTRNAWSKAIDSLCMALVVGLIGTVTFGGPTLARHPDCDLIGPSTIVEQNYGGETNLLCPPHETAFQKFNKFVWAITP